MEEEAAAWKERKDGVSLGFRNFFQFDYRL